MACQPSCFNSQVLIHVAMIIPLLAAGILIGKLVHHRVNQQTFSIIVFSALLVTGVVMLALSWSGVAG